MVYLYAVMVVGALAVGFVAGMVSLKRSQEWCPGCGFAVRCAFCPGHPTPRQVRESLRGGGGR